MFIGYQNDKISFIAETKEELENIPCVTLDRIEETGVEYVLHNGEYKPKAEVELEAKKEETEARIAELQAYLDSTDWYVTRYSEVGVPIPADVTKAREEARKEISTLRGGI